MSFSPRHLSHARMPTKEDSLRKAVVSPFVVRAFIVERLGLWYAGIHGHGLTQGKRCKYLIRADLHKAAEKGMASEL